MLCFFEIVRECRNVVECLEVLKQVSQCDKVVHLNSCI